MTRLLAGTLLPLLVACAPETSDAPIIVISPLESAPKTEGVSLELGESAILSFVNAPDTSFDVLDIDVGLDRRAAERIIRHRDGLDRMSSTPDDNHFDSLDELLSVDWVGPTTIDLLEHWVIQAATEGEVVDGVSFTEDEAILVVSLANTAEADYLDYDLELDVRAVEGILDARPIHNVYELAEVPFVGPATLERLRAAVSQ
jgi:hypothetical protein